MQLSSTIEILRIYLHRPRAQRVRRLFCPQIHGQEGQSIHSWRSRKLIDGSTASGYLMRRWVNGGWQYRALTEAEEEAHGELQVAVELVGIDRAQV
jgi:hypothetical protein